MSDIEPINEADTEEPNNASHPLYTKPKQAYSRLKRELSSEDLSSAGVQKMLVADIDSLEIENSKLKDFQEKFYEVDKKLAILEEQKKTYRSMEIFSNLCFAVGPLMIGLSPSVYQQFQLWWSIPLIGFLLLLSGIIVKVSKR